MWNINVLLDSYFWSLWTVKLLPHQDTKVTEGEECPKHITCSELQRAAHHQRIIQDWIVEDGDDLHVL